MKIHYFSIFPLWKKYKILLCLNMTIILALSLTLNLAAAGPEGNNTTNDLQQLSIKGTVTDASSKEAMPGVNVVIKGTTTGTMTDANGMYTLQVPNASATLLFSFVGYVGQEVALNGRTTLDIAMASETAQLDEVVVVGYGTQRKKDLTGAVTAVSAERLLDRPAFNVAQAIGGKIAGVKIIEINGAPGGNPMIRIRGTNSINTDNKPLFVVDGVVGVANALTILNPSDIASMDVLKDASATAIYGARGANGVIIITTKRGIAGKTQVEYDGYVSRGVMNRHIRPMNAEQFMYCFTQGWMNGLKYGDALTWGNCYNAAIIPAGESDFTFADMPYLFEKTTAGGYSVPLLGGDGSYYKPRFNTEWEEKVFRPSTSTNQQISIRGGTEKARFGAFFGYTLEDGLALSTGYNRISGRINGDMKVNDWFSISTNLAINRNKEEVNDNSYFSGGMARAALETYTILPDDQGTGRYPNDPDIYGKYAGQYSGNLDFPTGEGQYNPVMISDETEKFTNRDQFTGDIALNFNITKGLTLKSDFAVDINDTKYNSYASRLVSRGSQGSASVSTSNNIYWQNENYLTYQKTVGAHSFTGLLGLSWSRSTYQNLGGGNSVFFDDFYKWHNLGIGQATRPVPSSSDGQSSLNSYYARLNYSYKDKYLFTATGRIDGSSKFGPNTKYGFFPSASAAWRISEEDFAKSIANLSNLKLRFSIGQTGNQEIGSYVTQTFIGSGTMVMNGAATAGLYPSSFGNENLKWETNTQWDIGLDVGLFKERFTLALDYYHKLTEDMLLDVPLPRSTTVGSVKENYGTVENKGWEFTIGSHNVQGANFNWYTDVIFSANKNTIIKLGPTGADILRNGWVGGPNTILREGYPIAEFFGLQRVGVYSTSEASQAARYGLVPGDLHYGDANDDGVISFVADSGPIGGAFPKFDLNLNNNLTYKGFDFNLDIKFSYGAKKMNRSDHSGEDYQLIGGGKNTIINAWRPDYQNTVIAQVRPCENGAYYQTYPDTHWIEDCSFIRGEGMTLGYSLPKSIIGGINKLRVYFTAKNFFVITKYLGYDPEGSDVDNQGDALTPGIDFYMYPRPSVYSFGINIAF
jgi:TonB-dependent starch-binding outer membrane protein SusC